MKKFFDAITINSAEDIKTAVAHFQSFVFADGEKEVATKELIGLIEDYNATLKTTAIREVTTAECGMLNALVPSITLDAQTAKSDRLRKRAVYNAVAYTQYKVTEKDGKHEVRQTEKAITIRDIYTAFCDSLAFKHADMKVTKDDRKKAEELIIGKDEKTALALFIAGAYRFENVADALKDITIKASAEDSALYLDGTPSKAKAEKQIKRTAEMLGLGEINFKRSHALTLYKRAYTIDRYHQAKVVDALDFLQDFIISARYAKNNIEMPDIIDKSALFVVEDAPTDNAIIF